MTAWRGLVLGVGNLLLRDEGVGVHVVRAIEQLVATDDGAFPVGTRVVDGGTLGLDLLPLLEDADAVVLVDAANLRQAPGTVAVVRGDDLASAITGHLSVHQVGIGELLSAARLTGSLPAHVALVAIQPAEITPGLDLTPDVAAAISRASELVRAECWAQARMMPLTAAAHSTSATPGDPGDPGEHDGPAAPGDPGPPAATG